MQIWQTRNSFAGLKSYWDFRETGPWDPFLESPGNFSSPKATFKVKISCILASFLAHKPVNFVSFYFSCYSKVPVTFGPENVFCVCRVCISQDQSFSNLENDTMKPSVYEAILTGL